MQSLAITHPLISLNKLYAKHWASRKRLADEWYELIWAECKVQEIQPIRGYPVVMTYEVYLKNMNRDLDNIFGTIKMINDGLRYCGILENDSIRFIPRLMIGAAKGKEDKIIIHIS